MRRLVIASVLLGILALPASAQYVQDFENLNASPAGVILTGQDAYYLPNGAPSDVDFKVYTYAGNVLGIVQNPEGGAKFIAGTGPGDGVAYARAQRDVEFFEGTWEIFYDFNGIFQGTPPGSNNLGSFSMRTLGNTTHINLFTWVDPNSPTAINSTYVPYDAAGNQFPIPGDPPGPEWSNLMPNHWYRCRTVVNFDLNQIIEVGIRDLSGGPEAVVFPTGWYLYGGANPGLLPDAIRFFGGGSGPGNTTAWDNAVITPQGQPVEGACCLPDGTCRFTTEEDCAGVGQWMGEGTVCEPNPCTPVPAERTTWGGLKNKYR